MNVEKIEQAYELALTNVRAIQTQLATHFYDALIEQNAYYMGAEGTDETVWANNQALKDLALTQEEWRRVFQFLFIKANQTDWVQANHQFTPDSIGFILLFLLETLTDKDQLDVLEIGSGTGNLALTLLNNSRKQLDYLGLELDDLLIDLSASIAEVLDQPLSLVQEDAVRPQMLKLSDVIVSDLPLGYYPDDDIARRYQVASPDEHTYAHHLLMEQSLKYLKPGGWGIFLAPTNLLTSAQAPLLKKWLSETASVRGVITLPDKIFGHESATKSIFLLQKQVDAAGETLVYPLSDLQDRQVLLDFMAAIRDWQQV